VEEPKELSHDHRAISQIDRWLVRVRDCAVGLFLQPILVFVYRIRGIKPGTVRVHELVPDDDLPASFGCSQ